MNEQIIIWSVREVQNPKRVLHLNCTNVMDKIEIKNEKKKKFVELQQSYSSLIPLFGIVVQQL